MIGGKRKRRVRRREIEFCRKRGKGKEKGSEKNGTLPWI